MADNSTGQITYISKKYTENAEGVRWNTTGETSLNSAKSIKMYGQQQGVSFHKNDPVVLNAAPPFKVTKVEGPVSVVNENTYEFKATQFSEKLADHQLMMVNWAYSFDGGSTVTPFPSGTTRVEKGIAYKTVRVAGNHTDKEVSVYAYFRKPDTSVAARAKVVYLPLAVDIYRMPGLNEDGSDIANDMAYGKGTAQKPVYSAADIQTYTKEYGENGFDVNKHSKYANVAQQGSKGIYNSKQILENGSLMQLSGSYSDDQLFRNFRDMVGLMARGELNTNIYAMIDKFKSNTGGIYENGALTRAVIENPSTQRFCTGVEKMLKEKIQKSGGDLSQVEDKQVYFGTEAGYRSSHPYGHPAFPYSRDMNLFKGLTIAINDVWSYRVSLISFKQTGKAYKARYEVVLFDHFGLDYPDMEKFYSYGAGFRAWFVLQHMRGYKPFLTKVKFEKEFEGNI